MDAYSDICFWGITAPGKKKNPNQGANKKSFVGVSVTKASKFRGIVTQWATH